MGNAFSFAWEDTLIIWLQAHMGAAGTALASFFSMFGEEMLLILVLGFFYWCYDKELGKLLGRNICVVIVLNPMMKNLALRLRPYMVNPEIQCLKPVDASADIMDLAAQGYSFPSGHSSNAAAAYGTVGRWYRKTWVRVLAVVIPLLAGPRMLMNRNLIYTAVTRAKSCVVIVGDPEVFWQMVDNTAQQKRYSSLKQRLQEGAAGL